ncbi:MAG TPA: hypothetical protein VFE41_17180 [Acetobacteraceae bacterium]|jgi:acyl-CoA synthetase (NDP forming)|nr:hypothetical protein [Acetobacteraceae bacterium]
MARARNIAVAGPNNLGLINVVDRKAMWTPRYFSPVTPGPVAVISQIGSIALILSEDERKLGFSYLITTGNEAVVTVADYLNHVASDGRVGVILLFLETVRDPALFAQAARTALAGGQRIIAPKLGRSAAGRALGIVAVHDLDEMQETATLLSVNRAPPSSRHFVPVTLSGGEAALMADFGRELGIEYAKLAPATLARLRPAFPSYSSIGNPLDAWGSGSIRNGSASCCPRSWTTQRSARSDFWSMRRARAVATYPTPASWPRPGWRPQPTNGWCSSTTPRAPV